MPGRQMTTPLLLRGDKVEPLIRVSFDDKFKDEAWLQDLLFKFPRLLPIHELEPVFDEPIPLAKEVATGAGFIDLMYFNTSGFITIVETKLWRNPGSRREVISQLIDYAKEVSGWSYEELIAAVFPTPHAAETDPLVALAREHDLGVNEATFVDSVARNLRLGRVLLLVVGDGIQEGVEHLVEFFQQTPRLQYTLGLVEMALYRLEERANDQLLVQPRIIASVVIHAV